MCQRWLLLALGLLGGGALPLQARVPRVRPVAEVKTGWRAPVRGVAIDPTGAVLAAGGDRGEIVIFDIARQRIRLRLSAHGPVTALAISPDGSQLAVGWRGRYVDLVSLKDGRTLRRLGPLRGWPLDLAYSPKGDRLAVAGRAQRIALFDPGAGRSLGVLSGHTSWVNGVAFSPDGQRVAGAGWDHAVRIWDVRHRKLLQSGFGHRFAVNRVVFTHDGKRVISASDDQSLRVFNVSSGVSLKRVRGPAITSLALARRANVLVSGTYRGRLLLQRQQQLHPRRVVRAHRGPVIDVAVSADGRIVVTGGRDGRVKVWRIQ